MNNFFEGVKGGFGFLKKNPSLFFSLLLVIIIPLSLYVQTTFITRSFSRNIDFIIQGKALSIGKIVGAVASDHFYDPEALQERIFLITNENKDIGNITLFVKETESDFKVIASKDRSDIGNIVSEDTSLLLSWGKEQAIAYAGKEDGERFWNVVMPFGGAEKLGLISLSLSLKNSDSLVTNSVRLSYMILFALVVLILFLIIQHTRLFRYVFLSRRLQEVDEMKDQFIRMAIHELQAPMTNIRSYLYTLTEDLQKVVTIEQQPHLYQYIQRTILSAERLILLIQDMLQVSRIERGALDTTPKDTDPIAVIQRVVEEYQNKAANKGLVLEFLDKGEGYLLRLNPNRLTEIIVNLIDNAIKYTQAGKITVATAVNKSTRIYSILVEDTGIGISAEEQQKLFTKFYRVRNRETANISGTGLGLWIAKTLTEQMKGRIYIESLKGTGSRFSVVFRYIKK